MFLGSFKHTSHRLDGFKEGFSQFSFDVEEAVGGFMELLAEIFKADLLIRLEAVGGGFVF